MSSTPEQYIAGLEEPRRGEVQQVHDLIREAAPQLACSADELTIGYGPFHYRYASGREGDTHLISLRSNKNYISVYVLCTVEGEYLAGRYAERLPKASIGKSCVRFRRTSDVDLTALRELVAEAARIGPPA